MKEFLNDPTKKVTLIQGGSGTGKTLFGRYLERSLWNLPPSSSPFIPLFVSLPSLSDPYANLIETTLQSYFPELDISAITINSPKLVFILDGLDELPLEGVPLDGGIVIKNKFHLFPHSKIIFTCRTQYFPLLEQRVGSSYQHHLTLGDSILVDIFLMAFDESQVLLRLLSRLQLLNIL